jgi:hypothetical protein
MRTTARKYRSKFISARQKATNVEQKLAKTAPSGVVLIIAGGLSLAFNMHWNNSVKCRLTQRR